VLSAPGGPGRAPVTASAPAGCAAAALAGGGGDGAPLLTAHLDAGSKHLVGLTIRCGGGSGGAAAPDGAALSALERAGAVPVAVKRPVKGPDVPRLAALEQQQLAGARPGWRKWGGGACCSGGAP
jgi:hypothetical protein